MKQALLKKQKQIIIGNNNNPFNLHMWYVIIMLMIINIILRGENCEWDLGRDRRVGNGGGGREVRVGYLMGFDRVWLGMTVGI